MPRQLQSKIHSDFSSENYKWEIYQSQLQDLFDTYTGGEDFNSHLIREYNRKIERLNRSEELYLSPYDAGYSLTSNTVDGLKLSLDLNYLNEGDYTQSEVGGSNFLLTSRYGPNPVFTRASGATYRYSDGYLRYAPENLLLRSQDFSTTWNTTGYGTVLTGATTTAPDNISTAPKLACSTSAVQHGINQSISILGGVQYVFSCYAKKSELTRVALAAYDGSSYFLSATFDLVTGTVVSLGNGTGPASITYIGNDWYRCEVTGISGASASGTRNFQIRPNLGGAYNETTAGDGTSGIYIWGAQLERHSSARPYISTVASQVFGPRFEYDTSGNPIGLLVEESSANLLTYSEQFDNAAWTVLSGGSNTLTVSSNQATSPNNTTSADLVSEIAVSQAHTIYTSAGLFSSVNSTSYTISVFVKKGNGASAPDIVQLTFRSNGFGTSQYANFNITGTGSVTASSGGTAQINSVGSGWYRCSFTAVATSTATDSGFAFGFVNNDPNAVRLPSYLGQTTSNAYIWGAQLEAKSFATSYIPTVASTASRSADVCSISGSDFTSIWFNASEGTIVVQGDRNNTSTTGTPDLLNIGNGTTDEYMALTRYIGTEERFIVVDGTSPQVVINAGAAIAADTSFTIAAAYKLNDFAATLNGAAAVTDTAGTLPTVDRMEIGGRSGRELNGHIRAIKIYKKRLTDALIRLLPL